MAAAAQRRAASLVATLLLVGPPTSGAPSAAAQLRAASDDLLRWPLLPLAPLLPLLPPYLQCPSHLLVTSLTAGPPPSHDVALWPPALQPHVPEQIIANHARGFFIHDDFFGEEQVHA